MLSISVELVGGTIRAGSADDLALTGQEDPGEWPPSPARLFAALVAADGTGDRLRVTNGSELIPLEKGPPPLILADPQVCRSALVPRFVVIDDRAAGSVQEYPARRSREVRPGSRISPRTPLVEYRWPGIVLDSATLDALRLRCARVAYLGCSDSSVRVRASCNPVSTSGSLAVWEPTDESFADAIALPVAFPGLLGVLDDAYERFSSGEQVRRSWLPARRQWYRIQRPRPDQGGRPAIVWLRFDRSAPGRIALKVTETLRRATLELYDRWVALSPGQLPAVLTGHGFNGIGYQHAHWLALPEVGHTYATGRLHGAAVWLPPGTPVEIEGGVRSALVHLRELVLPGGRRIGLHPDEAGSGTWAANPKRWIGPSRSWASVLPVVQERWGPVTLDEVARWCEHAGLPRASGFQVSVRPMIQGALCLAPSEVFREVNERRPYAHYSMEFSQPLAGPVILGRGRQFGMGLFCPNGQDPRLG
ncbi:MAG: type I-G CRISPR-associated protein Csb2 [Acidimicrobiales bacterium]